MCINLKGVLSESCKFNGFGNFTTYGTIDSLLYRVPSVLNNFSRHVRNHMEYLEKMKGFSGKGQQLNSVNGIPY